MRNSELTITFKENRKRWILYSLTIFAIYFLVFLIYSLYQDYEYYKVYQIEELKTFFSFKKIFAHNFSQSFGLAFTNMIIYQPIFFILNKLKKKSTFNISLAIIIISIINFILFIYFFSL